MTLSSGKCVCDTGFWTGSDCEVCKPGYYYYKRAGTCLPCSYGCNECSSSFKCSACAPGWKLW